MRNRETAQESDRFKSDYSSGLFGLAVGEAASFHYVNLHRRQTEVELYFLDSDGKVLKQKQGLLLPYKALTLDLSFRELGSDGMRKLIRVHVRAGTPPDPIKGVASVDVSDEATGRTSFGLLLPAVARCFDPQPDPPSQSGQ